MSWVIVAIPEDRDPVWKYSSEKVPHMTLLFLGEPTAEANADLPRITQYIQHVAKTVMWPFGMLVDHRGTLGDEQADVLFFEKDRHGRAMYSHARDYFLADPAIKTLYDSTEQFPELIPHLTMGYPKTPAKKDDRDFGLNYVSFDRIALWTEDDAGPEFRLEGRQDVVESVDMIMSDDLEKFLAHFGVKGMHWGVRRNSVPAGETRATQKQPGKKVTTEGGKSVKAHEDAIRAGIAKQIAKNSTTDALSNQELQQLVTRMNLEQQYSKLSAGSVSPGRKFVNDLLINTAKQQATKIAADQASSLIDKQVKKATAK